MIGRDTDHSDPHQYGSRFCPMMWLLYPRSYNHLAFLQINFFSIVNQHLGSKINGIFYLQLHFAGSESGFASLQCWRPRFMQGFCEAYSDASGVAYCFPSLMEQPLNSRVCLQTT